MQKPRVSVIMAVRNKKNVKDVLEGILNQTYGNFEFIIIEDCSDDGITPGILDEYEKKDGRIKVFHNTKRMERCFSRNLAIKKSIGEYIAVTDGDDVSLPERLEREIEYLDSHPECYLVGARAYRVDDDGKEIGKSWGIGKDSDITKYMESDNRLVHSSVMFRNTGEYWYRDKFIYGQDYDFFLQIMADGKKISLLNDLLVIYTTRRDLVYNDYVIKQRYFAETAKYIYMKKRYEGVNLYGDIDTEKIEKYVPEDIILEMDMYKTFFEGKFVKTREILRKMIKKRKKFLWFGYYVDSFFGGTFYKITRALKRAIFYKLV